MTDNIELLRKQILFAHERIERLTKENLEFRLMIQSLLLSHHDSQLLAKTIEENKELFLAIGCEKPVADSDLDHVREAAKKAISLALSRQHIR